MMTDDDERSFPPDSGKGAVWVNEAREAERDAWDMLQSAEKDVSAHGGTRHKVRLDEARVAHKMAVQALGLSRIYEGKRTNLGKRLLRKEVKAVQRKIAKVRRMKKRTHRQERKTLSLKKLLHSFS